MYFLPCFDGFVTDANSKGTPLQDKLQFCVHNGWLHSDTNQEQNVAYVFSSSLHCWYVEHKLFNTLPRIPFESSSILEFAITMISGFSPKQLAAERPNSSGGIQRPLEAQYPDEFYQSCHTFSKGSILTFPEFGTKKGKVDFHIPANNWGVELVRNRDQLAQHSGHFS